MVPDLKNLLIKFRNIKVNYRMNLIEVKTDTREAVFENLPDNSSCV
jgi:hypothetical protein